MRIYLSVDFDYFSREEEEWDWGHNETPTFEDIAWYTRVRWYDDTSLERFAKPHPSNFWSTLQQLGYTFDDCRSFTVANSHMWAAHDFLNVSPGDMIINFDAHHDMGYSDWATLNSKWLRRNRVDCSNWLLLLLHRLSWLRAAVVYPPWKGERELDPERPKPWLKSKTITDRFQHLVYDEERVRELAGPVGGVFIAKSSAWLPPWHDEAFEEFVRLGSTIVGSPETPFVSQEGSNPICCRKFNLQEALGHERLMQEAINKLRSP